MIEYIKLIRGLFLRVIRFKKSSYLKIKLKRNFKGEFILKNVLITIN